MRRLTRTVGGYDIDSMLECREARVWGADLTRGAALHIECVDAAAKDAGGQSLVRRWVANSAAMQRVG